MQRQTGAFQPLAAVIWGALNSKSGGLCTPGCDREITVSDGLVGNADAANCRREWEIGSAGLGSSVRTGHRRPTKCEMALVTGRGTVVERRSGEAER